MGKWDVSCVDKDEFALKMWDETPEGMDIGVCFKSQSEAKHAVKLWNIHHKREYTVAASSPTTWAVRCRTLNVESEDGEPPCEWKMRVSLKAHGLHEIVWAYERIERIAPQRKGVDYLIDETAPLAQRYVFSVQNNSMFISICFLFISFTNSNVPLCSLRWECRYTYGDAPRSSTPPFRDQLTSLRVEDFRWQPYAQVLHRLPDFCKQGQAIWTTRCWMFCWAIREPHESGRVVRQFGYIQDVPKRSMIKDNAAFLLDHAHSMSGYPSNNWVDHHSAVHHHWNRREEYVLRDLEEGDPGSIYEGYYEWFMVNTVRLISNSKNYEPQGYEASSSRVKVYGEVLNNIRVSIEKFREKREDENLLDEELDEHLDEIINQTHAALTLGANDEMEVEDTQILVDEDPSLPSQPPPALYVLVIMDEGLLQNCNAQNGDDVEENCCTNNVSSTKVTASEVFSSLVALSGLFTYGCANGYSSPAESGIIDDLNLSTAQYSLFGSLCLFGTMFGAIISGRISDFIGRRGDVWWLDSGRFLLGFGSGIQIYVSVIYVAEIIPKSIREAFTMASHLMVCSGVMVMFSSGNLIAWRALASIGIIPCFIQFIALIFIPESPRWLAKVGRHKEAESSLQWLRGQKADVSQEAAEILVGVGLPFWLPWSGTNGILLYASSISDAAGQMTSIFVQIPFAVLGVLLSDKFGRRPLLIMYLAGVCLGGILIGVGFVFQSLRLWTNVTPTIVFIGIQMHFGFFAFGAGLPLVIISEIFPMNIKSSAESVATFAQGFNSWVVACVFNFLVGWSSAGTFLKFSSICVVLIVFVVKMLPETKDRSLEEIEASWTQDF
ncbi:OLC1v1000600C1 [Oldenlandia corymbosa var. corymbosa]|uniref:OLC1v1000600C1 n=1 Tax=Oldenlandia corymbosa var. corymbosa TaxID=529605 RepID=A0AAV1D386_OLDCO|nr:OLC1v1000600C1 [Oldenlandia corymbosa var. corymbosa]